MQGSGVKQHVFMTVLQNYCQQRATVMCTALLELVKKNICSATG